MTLMVVATTYVDEAEAAPLTSHLHLDQVRCIVLNSPSFFPLSFLFVEERKGAEEGLSSAIFVVALPQYIPRLCEDPSWSFIIWVKPYC